VCRSAWRLPFSPARLKIEVAFTVTRSPQSFSYLSPRIVERKNTRSLFVERGTSSSAAPASGWRGTSIVWLVFFCRIRIRPRTQSTSPHLNPQSSPLVAERAEGD
jgi:hypothetical protein